MKRLICVLVGILVLSALSFYQSAYAGLVIQSVSDMNGIMWSENTIAGSSCNGVGPNNPYAMGATVAGGGYLDSDASACYANMVDGNYGTVSGGSGNTSSYYATVPGGQGNEASGFWSWAGGRLAKAHASVGSAVHAGAFVWADSNFPSAGQPFYSTAVDEFAVRARGGIRLITNVDLTGNPTNRNIMIDSTGAMNFGDATRQMLNLNNNTYAIGVQPYRLYFRVADTTSPRSGFVWFNGGSHVDTTDDPGTGGSVLMTLTPAGLKVLGTDVSSDRNIKNNVIPVDNKKILESISLLPITEWSFNVDPDVRHIGPMAQDFREAFGLGHDDRFISTVDAQGISLAAIQELNRLLQKQTTRIASLEATITDRDTEIQSLKTALLDIASRLAALEGSGKAVASK